MMPGWPEVSSRDRHRWHQGGRRCGGRERPRCRAGTTRHSLDQPDGTEETIIEIVAELSSRHDVSAVGIGAAGYIDADRSTVRFSPHLAWREEPLRAVVGGRTGLPVVIENDANAGAWAEYRFGAAGVPVLAWSTLAPGSVAGSWSTASCSAAATAWEPSSAT